MFKDQPTQGNLYYIRLSTHIGIVYKLGFTTLNSAQERLAFQGKGHEQLIDEVIFFYHFDDAYQMEQALHAEFQHKTMSLIPNPDMPLFENGQSEVYTEDILAMDESYTELQAQATQTKILELSLRRAGKSEHEIEAGINAYVGSNKFVAQLEQSPLGWLFRTIAKLSQYLESNLDKAKRLQVSGYMERIRAKSTSIDEARIERQKKLDLLNKELARTAKVPPDIKTHVTRAIAAFNKRDLTAFERLVDIDSFGVNLSHAMTADLTMPSDYLIIANNCWLTALVNEGLKGNASALLLMPVQTTYKALLRRLVVTHSVLVEDLIMPDDPIYQEKEDANEGHPTLSDYFGPKTFLNLFDDTWSVADIPIFTTGTGWVEFPIEVKNATTGFEGAMIVRATFTDDKRLDLKFPNFICLQEAAYALCTT